MGCIIDRLGLSIGCATSVIEDSHEMLAAYNKQKPAYAHKLSVVQFGEQFVGVDFDPDRSCWYNPNNIYGMQNSFFDATLDALAVRLEILPPALEQLQAQHGATT